MLIRTAEELTAQWLSEVVQRPALELESVVPIGTGQLSQSLRARYVDGEGGAGSVVVKLASEDPTSRATGTGMGAYLREVSFYRNLAARLSGPVPACVYAEYDAADGWFTLVLEDIADATQGDQIAGCSVEQARQALVALSGIHAPVLGDVALGAADWLNQPNPLDGSLLAQLLPAFLERYGDRVSDEHADLARQFVARLDGWAADRRPPLGLVHGDYRLDNLLFGPDGCRAVDWQTVSWGPALADAAYFIGSGLNTSDRREHERELVALYHQGLIDRGVTGLSLHHCWEEYRRRCFTGVVMTIAAPMVVQRTERGDEMFMVWFARAAQQALDLDALSLLPEPVAAAVARPLPLRPQPVDEGRHEPGPETLWNESWYFDAVSDGADLGVYVRLGRLPNQGVALYTACICGPGRPCLMLVAADAPLPAAGDELQRIELPSLRCEQECLEPLERFRVAVAGEAQVFEDESAPLRGKEASGATQVAIELVWETAGVPYAWRQTTRYEIPCRVTGAVTIGGERMTFAGPGQRDHSWSARDWWAVDWMWNGLHLEDGTHIHAVGIPQMPGYGVGYVQRDGELEEITSVRTAEQVRGDGLVAAACVQCGPMDLTLEIEPLAFGALRLQAPDGRLSLFPRAMCRVRAADGRTGTGWIEWNRVQRGSS